MKNKNLSLKTAVACAAIGWMCWSAGSVCNAQNPSGLSPDLQEVVKLSQAKMPDDVIRNYINSSGKSYYLSADDIIYLNSQGVSPGVISALQTAAAANPNPPSPPVSEQTTPPPPANGNYPQPPPAAGPPPTDVQPTPPPPPEVNFDYFHAQLSPWGTWINVGGVTYWRPDQAMAANPDWRPYYDMGQWVQTDNGLYWQSDYTWGDIPFHYGRWVILPGVGWVWAPDYTWGPAWVFWRQDAGDACIGWAPLPVGALFVNGVFWFNGVAVSADFGFGLGFNCFTFVSCDHFHESFFRMRGHEWAYHVDRVQVNNFYTKSVVRNDFHKDTQGRFVNYGIGREQMEHLTHVEHATFEERNPVGDRNKLAQTRTEEFHKTVGGPGQQGHVQPNNLAVDRNIKTTGGENNTPHDNNFHGQNFNNARTTSEGSVSKVYRPPVGGGGPPKPQAGGGGYKPQSGGGGQPQPENKKKQ